MGDSASNEPWLAPGFNFFGHFKLAKVWLTSVWKRRLPHVEPEEREKAVTLFDRFDRRVSI